METILEIILGREILLHYLPQTEKEQKTSPLYRYIRLDVWGQDQRGSVYDVEVQKKDTKNLSRRSRFYQGIVDGKMLKPGEVDFNQLKDCYIIMIAPFDPFGLEKYQYIFEMRCTDEPELSLQDGAVRIFLNTHGRNREDVSPELAELLEFMEHTNSQPEGKFASQRIQELHRRVEDIKSREETGVKYMQAWEERELERREAREEGRLEGLSEGLEAGRQEGLETGRIEGLAVGRYEGLKDLIRKKRSRGKSEAEIAEALEEDVETIKRLMKEL